MDIEKIYRAYSGEIYLFALRMSGNEEDAKDIVHETFAELCRNHLSLESRRRLRPWLFRVAMNRALNLQRKERIMRMLTFRKGCQGVFSEPPQREGKRDFLLEERVREAVMTLRPRLRAAVTLVWLQGMTHREAGEILGCSEGAVSWRIFKAKEGLKTILHDIMQEWGKTK